MRPRSLELDWDEENVGHLSHGLTRRKVIEVVDRGDWVMVRDKRRRSRRKRLVGRDARGELWTIIMEKMPAPGRWRPITGWPATPIEVLLYKRIG